MARHYSSKNFFRQIPNALLARYFQGRELFGDLDFTAMKEGKPDKLFDSWISLSNDQPQGLTQDPFISTGGIMGIVEKAVV